MNGVFSKKFLEEIKKNTKNGVLGRRSCYRHYIYFILDVEYGAVKIGISVNVKKRLKAIQSHNLHPLKILKTIRCEYAVSKIPAKSLSRSYEQKIHEIFQDQRLTGEWFKYEGVLKEFIEKL